VKKVIFVLLGVCLAITCLPADIAQAQAMDISINKDAFYPWEQVVVTTTVENNQSHDVEWYVECAFDLEPYDALVPVPRRQVALLELEPGQIKEQGFSWLIDDVQPSGRYKATLGLFENYYAAPQMLNEKTILFDITGTLKIIDITLISHGDDGYNKTVFIKKERISLDYESEISDLNVSGTLTLPDESTKELSLPTSMTAEQIGTYELTITAAKEGYKTAARTMEFSVIEEAPEIPFATPRWDINEDGIVDYKDLAILGAHYGETTQAPYPRYDIDRDGEVETNDVDVLMEHYGEEASH